MLEYTHLCERKMEKMTCMPMLLFGLWVVRSVTLVSSASSKKETAKNFSLIFTDH